MIVLFCSIYSLTIPPFVLTILKVEDDSLWIVQHKMYFICAMLIVWKDKLSKEKVSILLKGFVLS